MTDDLALRVAAAFVAAVCARPPLVAAVRALLRLLADQEPAARLFACGGLVRDLALATMRGGRAAFRDLDLVVEGVTSRRLDQLLPELRARCRQVRRVERVGASFPVWKVKVSGLADPVDLAVVRTRSSFGAGRGALAEETPGLTVADDAGHRDFTMNALFVELRSAAGGELEGALHDFHRGLEAITRGEVRCVGDPAERFAEDPLRVLRAVRFAASLPGFAIEPKSAAAIRARAPGWLASFARDRIADELCGALVVDPSLGLRLLDELGLLAEILPDLVVLGLAGRERAAARIAALPGLLGRRPAPPLLFAALLLDLAVPPAQPVPPVRHTTLASRRIGRLARELVLPDVRRIGRLCFAAQVLLHFEHLESADAAVEEVLVASAEPNEALVLYRAAMGALGRKAVDHAGRVAGFTPTGVDFGSLVERAGLPAGPRLQRVKLTLRQAEIEGRVGGEEEALALLRRLDRSGAE